MSTRMLDERLPVACGLLAADGRLVDCNAAFVALLGLDRETLLTSSWDEGRLGEAVRAALVAGREEIELPAGQANKAAGALAFSLHVIDAPVGDPHVLAVVELAARPISPPEAESGASLRSTLAEVLAEQIELRQRNRHLEAILESTPDMIFIHDQAGRLVEVNDKVSLRFGFTRGQLLMMGDLISIIGGGKEEAKRHLAAALRGESQDFEAIARTFQGEEFPVEINLRALQGELGTVVAAVRDIGPRKQAEARLAAAETRFRALVEQSLVGIYIVQDGIVSYANPGLAQMFGFDGPADLIEKVAALDLVAAEDRDRVIEQFRRIADGSEGLRFRFAGRRRNKTPLQVEIHGRQFECGGRPAMIGVLVDVSERCRFENELERRASYDALTGLPNRTLLFDRLDQAIAHSRRHDELFAFLFLDLDGFKAVNDRGGHEAGDQVLRIVAERFRAVLRESDTLARLGGDEFAVIAPELLFGDDVIPVAQKLCDTLKSPITFGGRDYTVGVSIGIALFPAAADDASGLYRAADTAMYAAKEQCRGSYRFAPSAGMSPVAAA
ncbi:MAG: diguanylate cyclase domain-containing protein [Betaproteobacteria bacterium]